MNAKTTIWMLWACVLALSCNTYSPEVIVSPVLVQREFSASLDAKAPTRTTLSPECKVLWDLEGESISMIDAQGNCYELFQKSVSDDRKSAVFAGVVPESACLYAVYPAQAEVIYDNGRVGLSIPTEQEALSGTFDTATNLAMAKIDDGNALVFKNVCGMVSFCINASSGITSIRLSATETGGGALTGSAMVEYGADAPYAVSDKAAGAEYVELQGDIQPMARYYALVFPGTYSNMELTVTDELGRTATIRRASELTVLRNNITSFNTITIAERDWTGGEEPGGTATLTYNEASACVKGYNNPVNYENEYGVWTVSAYNTGSAFQLNKDKVAYIGTPEMPGIINTVILHNSAADRSGNLIVCTEPGTTSPSGDKVESAYSGTGDYTIDVAGLASRRLYIRSSAMSHITSVTLVWGGGSLPGPDPDPDPGPDIPVPDPNGLADYGWFELPAQTDKNGDGIDDNVPDYYYSHTFRADAPKIRNFSCCYSKGNMQPVWVAAPMHNSYKGSSGRNDSYKSDPNIKCAQAGKVDGYTKGHMLGSSDRTVSKETNRQVFYYSNIGAQLQSGFNTGGGAWNNLESLTDGQWCADTLYQVIGCIFTSFTDKYGKTVAPKTVGSVHIPTAYYKVLLRTKSGKTGKRVDQCAASELKCAAFILGHRSNAGHKPSASDMYTVEELEAMTGLTFFVNVPNAPKSVAVAGDWGL